MVWWQRYTGRIDRKNDCSAVENLIHECYFNEIPSQTAINDFLWFERDTIAQHLGYTNWEAYEYNKEEDTE